MHVVVVRFVRSGTSGSQLGRELPVLYAQMADRLTQRFSQFVPFTSFGKVLLHKIFLYGRTPGPSTFEQRHTERVLLLGFVNSQELNTFV